MARRFLPILALLLTTAAPAWAQQLFTGTAPAAGDAARGQRVYAQSCAACHGPRLEGSPFAPTLTGETFRGKWRGRPATELLEQMRQTMPPKGTGTVAPEAFAHLLAFVIRANVQGVPAATAERSAPGTAARSPAAPIALAPQAVRQLAALKPVSDALLAAPPEGDWLMWRRTPDAAGFSPLRQIDRGSVSRLQQAWSHPLSPSGNEITPLVHDGVLFVLSGSVVEALDAASGAPLWQYRRETARPGASTRQFDPGQRARVKSIAIHGHTLFVPTPDSHLVALDARNGQVLWDRAISSGASTGLQLSSGPLVARGVVMLGVSLGLTNPGGCFILGLDAATGAERWRFRTVAQPGTPGGDTWNDAPAEERFGGGVWTTGSYDPTLDIAYFGVGNTYTTATLLQPREGAAGVTRNDGLYTNATLALRPETGELLWHHQHHRRDVWDQDWAFEQTLLTLGTGAGAKRAVVTSGKTGIIEALDAATGALLFAHDTEFTNLFLGIDAATGAKQPNPALEPLAGKTLLLCPSNFGARNWPATALDPDRGILFLPMLESCADFTWQPRSRRDTASGGSDMRFAPRPRPDGDGNLGRVMALDLQTRRVLWTHRQRTPLSGSLLATAGGLLFAVDLDRQLSAFDQSSGQVLWRARLPAAAESNPVTYAVNGRQFIAVVSGEGSHLGVNNRRLVPELPEPVTQMQLIVFALPAK